MTEQILAAILELKSLLAQIENTGFSPARRALMAAAAAVQQEITKMSKELTFNDAGYPELESHDPIEHIPAQYAGGAYKAGAARLAAFWALHEGDAEASARQAQIFATEVKTLAQRYRREHPGCSRAVARKAARHYAAYASI